MRSMATRIDRITDTLAMLTAAQEPQTLTVVFALDNESFETAWRRTQGDRLRGVREAVIEVRYVDPLPTDLPGGVHEAL